MAFTYSDFLKIKALRPVIERVLHRDVQDLKEEGSKYPNEKQISEYVDLIVKNSVIDPDYDEMVREEGDPSTWEFGWVCEFISEHSDFYVKWRGLEDEEEQDSPRCIRI